MLTLLTTLSWRKVFMHPNPLGLRPKTSGIHFACIIAPEVIDALAIGGHGMIHFIFTIATVVT